MVGEVLGRWLMAAAFLMAAAHGRAQQQVIIISPHTDAIRREFARGFVLWHEKQYGEPVNIEWRDMGGTSDALRFVQSEFSRKPEGIGIDVFFGGGLEPYLLLADKNLALPYEPPPEVLQAIPQNVNGVEIFDPKHRWFGAALSSFGILQNLTVQRLNHLPQVSAWGDLSDPRLLGWVGAGDPRNSGTMGVMFEAFLQYYGWEKGWQVLTEISGNVRKFDRIASTTAKDVTLGETAYAFCIDFYGFTQVAAAGRSNLAFTLPQDFTTFSPDGIALLKGAPHLPTAGRFLNFVLSEPGQKLWFLPRGHPAGPRDASIERMAVRPDFYKRYADVSNVQVSPFTLHSGFHYDADLSRKRRDVVAALVGALLVDTHPELKIAWRHLLKNSLAPEARAAFGRAPVSEREAFDLAAGPWKSPAFRNQKKIEWQTWARKKYRGISFAAK